MLALIPLFFSSNLVIGRAAMGHIEPWTLAFLRWVGALLILLPFAGHQMLAHLKAIKVAAREILVLGFLGMWVCGGLVYVALRWTTASSGTLIYATSPIIVILLEWRFRGRRLTRRQVLGCLIAFAGVAAIVSSGDVRNLAVGFNPGDVLMGVAAVAWAAYSVLLKRPALSDLPTITLFTAIVAAGALLLLPFAAWELSAAGALPRGAAPWLSVASLALISSVLAFSSYQFAVKRFGPSATSLVFYLLPLYGVGLAVTFLGEALGPEHFLGTALIVPGLVLATAPVDLVARRPALGEKTAVGGGQAGG